MQCPNCETENRDDAKFCDECGFPLGGVSTHVASGPSTTAEGPGVVGEGVDFAEAAGWAEPKAEPGSADVDAEGEAEAETEAETDAADAVTPSANESFDVPAAASEADAEQARSSAVPAPSDPLPGFSDLESESQLDEDVSGDASRGGADEWRPDATEKMPRVEGSERPEKRDFRAGSAQVQGKRKGVRAAIAVAVVALVAVGIAAGYAFGLWGGKVVPDVIGMTEPDAESSLAAEGFAVRSTQVKSDDTEGLVLLMDPDANSRAPEGSEVVIHIAAARVIPEVVGKKLEEAESALSEAGYENIVISAVKSDDAENVVLSVDPKAGTRAKSNAEVTVTVTEAYRVPDISGLDIGAAREAITDAGLTPVVEYVDTEQYEDGTILGTTPDAGSKVTEGESVTVNVARARGAELEDLTEGLLSPGSSVTVDGVDYDIESLDYVRYEGDDTVAFSFTGRPKITFFGEVLYASGSQDVEGEVVWSEGNKVVSIS